MYNELQSEGYTEVNIMGINGFQYLDNDYHCMICDTPDDCSSCEEERVLPWVQDLDDDDNDEVWDDYGVDGIPNTGDFGENDGILLAIDQYERDGLRDTGDNLYNYSGDPFTDTNGDGIFNDGEEYVDNNNDGQIDTSDSWANYVDLSTEGHEWEFWFKDYYSVENYYEASFIYQGKMWLRPRDGSALNNEAGEEIALALYEGLGCSISADDGDPWSTVKKLYDWGHITSAC